MGVFGDLQRGQYLGLDGDIGGCGNDRGGEGKRASNSNPGDVELSGVAGDQGQACSGCGQLVGERDADAAGTSGYEHMLILEHWWRGQKSGASEALADEADGRVDIERWGGIGRGKCDWPELIEAGRDTRIGCFPVLGQSQPPEWGRRIIEAYPHGESNPGLVRERDLS